MAHRLKGWWRLLRWRGSQSPPTPNTPPSGGFVRPTGGRQQVATLGNRVDHVEDLTRAVLYVTIATMVGVLVSLGGIVAEQWRFNQQAYTDSAKAANDSAAKAQEKVDSLNAKIDTLTTQLQKAQENQDANQQAVKDK